MFFLACVCYAFVGVLFICALWSLAGKGLASLFSFVMSNYESLSLSNWYPGSGVVLDCIDSLSLYPYLLLFTICSYTYVLVFHCSYRATIIL